MISPYLSPESSRRRVEAFVKSQAKKGTVSKRYPEPVAKAILSAVRTGTVVVEDLYVR